MRKQLEATTTGRSASTANSPFVQLYRSFLRDPRLSPEAKVVGALYASYADGDGWAWPGLAMLIREAHMGRDKVKRAKKELVRAGLLELQRQRTLSGQFVRSRYRVSEKVLVHHSTGTQYRGHRVHSTEKPLYG